MMLLMIFHSKHTPTYKYFLTKPNNFTIFLHLFLLNISSSLTKFCTSFKALCKCHLLSEAFSDFP